MNKIVLFFSLISVFNVFYAAERSAIKDEALNALLGKLAQGSSSDDENGKSKVPKSSLLRRIFFLP